VSAAADLPPIRMVLIGAAGRMGLNILRQLPSFPALRLCGALVSERSSALGEDASVRAGAASVGVKLSAALPPLLRDADLAIDFSSPRAAAANLAACVAAGVPLLLGTTGLPRELQAPLAAAADSIALLVAPNTSPGLNLLLNSCARPQPRCRAATTSRSSRPTIAIRPMHHRVRPWPWAKLRR